MSENFCLKWKAFHSNVSNAFGLLRNEDYLHDVTLVSDNHKQISAHKLVLSACSEHFKDIFKYSNKPNAHTLLCLDGIKSDDLENILDYIYNGEVRMLQDNLDRFLMVAQKLKLKGLMGKDYEYSQQKDDNSINMNTVKEECTTEELKPADKPKEDNIVEDKVKVPVSSESINELENALNQHLEKLSPGLYQCKLYGKTASNQHLEKLSPGLYQCKLCGRTMKKNTDLKKHIETHIDGLSYPCKMCGKIFSTTNSLRSHRSQHHKV